MNNNNNNKKTRKAAFYGRSGWNKSLFVTICPFTQKLYIKKKISFFCMHDFFNLKCVYFILIYYALYV